MFGFGAIEILIPLIFVLIPLLLWIFALVDIIKSEFAGSNKLIWIIVVLLLPFLGAILYFVIGRKQKVTQFNAAGSVNRFCSECGEELNPRAEICPKCGVRQAFAQKTGTSVAAVILVVVLVGVGSVVGIGIMAAIAVPQFSSYRQKAYDSAALSDLKNAKTAVEAFYADKQKYPTSLDQTGSTASLNVSIQYELEKDGKGYVIVSSHKDGAKLYMVNSTEAHYFWRDAKDEKAEFQQI